jgi:subtilisin-like proprotein convertase family protein
LVAGQFGDSASFGNYKPATTTTYTTTNPVSPTPSAPNALSSLAIRDTSFIQDPTVTLTVTNPSLLPLTIVLHAPDGTSITLAASTNSNGTLSFHVPAFDGKNVNGTWTLEVDGLSGGTLNSWSMSVLG